MFSQGVDAMPLEFRYTLANREDTCQAETQLTEESLKRESENGGLFYENNPCPTTRPSTPSAK